MSGEKAEVPDTAVTAALAAYSRTGMAESDGAMIRRVLEAALPHLTPEATEAPDLTAVPWRQGRRKRRNLYAVTGEDWEAHPEIGCLDTAELAAAACAAHNERLGCHRCGHRIMTAEYSPSGWTHWSPPWERPGWEGILCPSGGEAGPAAGWTDGPVTS